MNHGIPTAKGLALMAPAFFMLAAALSAADAVQPPLGLLPIDWPKDNLYTQEKAELGRLLYFDKRLSADGTVACASCHSPAHAFAEPTSVSTGIRSQKGGRNSPTVINTGYIRAQFWDGRAATLEEQAKGPIANPIEMGNTHEACVTTLQRIEGYRPLFAKAFGSDEITIDNVAKAIATFERTVVSGNAPYDRYMAGDKQAMTPPQIRGMKIFFQAKCAKCHAGPNFTLDTFHNLGVGADRPNADVGRFAVTKSAADWGAFKTPTLREVANTAPYMHDGSMETLEEVIDFYNKGGTPNRNLSADMKPLKLTAAQKADLIDFLHALSGEGWQNIKPPQEFPQ